jgi:hypothetical protein
MPMQEFDMLWTIGSTYVVLSNTEYLLGICLETVLHRKSSGQGAEIELMRLVWFNWYEAGMSL